MAVTIGGWTDVQLRQFIVNQILTDPGSLPKPKPADPTAALPTAHSDGDVPVWDRASQRWVPSTQHAIPGSTVSAIPFSSLSTWTWAAMGWGGNYGAAPDKWLRNATGGGTSRDLHSTDFGSWITSAANFTFQFPIAGKYLIALQNSFPHQQTGEYFQQLFDWNTGASMAGIDGVRGYVTAGNDVFANFSGGTSVGIVDIDATLQTHTWHPIGFYNGGSSMATYVTAIRIPS